ncbi:c-type cytochrome [Granulosicoccus sp. 3-233]|uniref:c-type cytochrome n=1 Tax=Granulosicoccus sp. 3-233 TaxID=3417969 RepID=UPI003D33637E
MKKFFVLIVPAVALLCSSAVTIAEDGPHDDAIKARQSLMQLYGYHVGILSAMAKEKMEYDAELATEAADNLLAVSRMGQSTLWPQGSDNSNPDNAENRALPVIWETYPEIAEKGKALNDALVALSAEAGNGLDALQDSMGDVGGSCKGCHDDYRAEKK